MRNAPKDPRAGIGFSIILLLIGLGLIVLANIVGSYSSNTVMWETRSCNTATHACILQLMTHHYPAATVMMNKSRLMTLEKWCGL